MKNYKFVGDYVVIIITDETEENAIKTLKETVKYPKSFGLDSVEEV